VELFHLHHPRLVRFLHRATGDGELAADVAQEAFVRLYRREVMPDSPEAWLISVALNLVRNERTRVQRRGRLLTAARSEQVLADPPAAPDDALAAEETRRRVRSVLDELPARDRALLLLQAEGYGYREIALALELKEASLGVFLARARRAFRAQMEKGGELFDAS
jgi:RNA polymerase sigma factor (sigma-70 family)